LAGAVAKDAFWVKCDAELNPQSSVDNGIVNVQCGVSIVLPAEFIIISIGQFDGGTSVSTSL
jgi:uncharacterized protein